MVFSGAGWVDRRSSGHPLHSLPEGSGRELAAAAAAAAAIAMAMAMAMARGGGGGRGEGEEGGGGWEGKWFADAP